MSRGDSEGDFRNHYFRGDRSSRWPGRVAALKRRWDRNFYR